jgi:hypothetical protein
MMVVANECLRGTVLIAATAAALSLTACGGTTSNAGYEQARQAAASQQAQTDAQASLAAQVQELKADADRRAAASSSARAGAGSTQGSTGGSTSVTSCGSNVSVGGNTSCAFGQNVASAFLDAGGGTTQVTAYSPVTGTNYSMSCVSGIPSVCRGGNSAVVYIR